MNKAMRLDLLLLLAEAASVLEGTFGPEDKVATELRDFHRKMLAVEPYKSSPMSKARVETLNRVSRTMANKKREFSDEALAKMSQASRKYSHTPEARAKRSENAKKNISEQPRKGGKFRRKTVPSEQ